jgi:uncharacterized DUF497 family protein
LTEAQIVYTKNVVSSPRQYSWTEAKRETNRARHGIDFSAANDFEWNTALVLPDLRHDYGETRIVAFGKIGERLHVLVYTPRGPLTHVISLRKANEREIRKYESNS